MIELRDVSKFYSINNQKIVALNNISINISEGELVAITGSSGSGKSTLLNVIGLLDNPSKGLYLLKGQDVSKVDDDQASNHRNQLFGFIFQSFHLINSKTALENVELPLFYQGVSKRIRKEKAMGLLIQLGLKNRESHYPYELSGGQKQRVAIARALSVNPEIILADEPTGALDNNTSTEIMQILKDLNRLGKTVIIITHDMDVANQCSRVIRVEDGVVCQ